MKPVVLYGINPTAREILEVSKRLEMDFNIAAFCLGDSYLKGETSFCGLPLVAESEVVQKYPPGEYDMLSCVDAWRRLRDRLLIYERLKGMGYFLRNFIHPYAYLSGNIQIGENNIIMSYVRIEYGACIGHSNMFFSGATISHHNVIGNGTNINDKVILGGFVYVGDSCYLGLGSIVNNGIVIENDTLVASGAVVLKNTKQGYTYIGNPAKGYCTHQETGIMMNFPQEVQKKQ